MRIWETASVALAAITVSVSAVFADEAAIRTVCDGVCRIDKMGKAEKDGVFVDYTLSPEPGSEIRHISAQLLQPLNQNRFVLLCHWDFLLSCRSRPPTPRTGAVL